MKLIGHSFIVALLFITAGCNFTVKDMQLVEISVLKDEEKNDQVAQALMFYSPQYFIHNIKSLNKNNYAGVQTGYVKPSNTNKSNFRVFYVMNNGALDQSEVDKLKIEFENYIPKLAKEHASKIDVFESESITKKTWIKDFFNSDGEDKYLEAFSQVMMKESEKVRALPQQISRQLGLVEQVKYIRGQYYKAFNGFHEQVVLNFEVAFDSSTKAFVSISLDDNNQIINIDLKQIMT